MQKGETKMIVTPFLYKIIFNNGIIAKSSW